MPPLSRMLPPCHSSPLPVAANVYVTCSPPHPRTSGLQVACHLCAHLQYPLWSTCDIFVPPLPRLCLLSLQGGTLYKALCKCAIATEGPQVSFRCHLCQHCASSRCKGQNQQSCGMSVGISSSITLIAFPPLIVTITDTWFKSGQITKSKSISLAFRSQKMCSTWPNALPMIIRPNDIVCVHLGFVKCHHSGQKAI